MGIVRLHLVDLAQFEHLLKIGQRAGGEAGRCRLVDRASHGVELGRVTTDISRVRNHASQHLARLGLLNRRFPRVDVGLGADDHHLVIPGLERQDLVPLGELV